MIPRTFTNSETGMESYVVFNTGRSGGYNVTLKDLDADEMLTTSYIGIRDYDAAVHKAKELVQYHDDEYWRHLLTTNKIPCPPATVTISNVRWIARDSDWWVHSESGQWFWLDTRAKTWKLSLVGPG